MLVVLKKTEAGEEILSHKAKDAGASSKQADTFVGLIFGKTVVDGEKSDLLDEERKFSLGSQMCYSFFGKGSRGYEAFLKWSQSNISPSVTQVVIKALWSEFVNKSLLSSPANPELYPEVW
jgi:hypothetical protein